jgi:hypothetical protein
MGPVVHTHPARTRTILTRLIHINPTPAPKPTSPTTTAATIPGTAPLSIKLGAAFPLNGTYAVVPAGSKPSPVPPPVKFAPLGPMGPDVSWNLHESDVQTQVPLMGSQKGVEQLPGTEIEQPSERAWKEDR